MVCRDPILEENKNYWTDRAPGYSEVNRLELATAQRQRWKNCICEELTRRFPDRPLADLQVLEVGTGPGFFAILLRELGCAVTAIDLTCAMLAEAKENAGPLADGICFMEMNAEALSFAPERFDAVISRNLTWNLPHPDRAYAEWTRVLKKGGIFAIHDLMEPSRYGDMDDFLRKLREEGFQEARLLPTADGTFMTRGEGKRLFLSGSTLLVGRK